MVSVPEGAKMLAVSKAMFYKLVADGAFPIIKIGSRSVIRVADIESYVDSCPTGVGEFPKKKNGSPVESTPNAAEQPAAPVEPSPQHANQSVDATA